jgi:uncharacterized phage infection (PIP) family protein YhgE
MSFKWLIIFVLILASGFLGYAAWKSKQPVQQSNAPVQTTPPKKEWTPEEIAKDPQSYLVWSQQQVDDQIKGRQQRLSQLSSRRAEFVSRQQGLVQKMKDVENFHNRLKSALQRAEDEDRWPVRMAGTTYERARALELIEQTKAWVDDRRGLADAYNSSLAKMDDSAAVLKNDIRQLEQLKEKLALDLERVKINESMADLEKLRQTESQLASMSKSLSQMSDEQAPVLPVGAKSERVDIDAIVK